MVDRDGLSTWDLSAAYYLLWSEQGFRYAEILRTRGDTPRRQTLPMVFGYDCQRIHGVKRSCRVGYELSCRMAVA